MIRRASIVAALLGSFALVSAASAGQVVYVGGHNAASLVRVMPTYESAPYALTGETLRNVQRYELIRQDSRIVGVRPVGE